MITGIGVDLIEVNRVIQAFQKEGFKLRYFTQAEIDFIQEDYRLAADNFAVKEAVAKMLGTGFRGFTPIAIEVLRNPQGKPFVNLYGEAAKIAQSQGVTNIHVSLTNTKDYANAFVVGEA